MLNGSSREPTPGFLDRYPKIIRGRSVGGTVGETLVTCGYLGLILTPVAVAVAAVLSAARVRC